MYLCANYIRLIKYIDTPINQNHPEHPQVTLPIWPGFMLYMLMCRGCYCRIVLQYTTPVHTYIHTYIHTTAQKIQNTRRIQYRHEDVILVSLSSNTHTRIV